eukprot:1177149-Prorocentrum_minimum.AAC.2
MSNAQGCQRYWTAGGMLRNVLIGAGRRKTKNSVQVTTSTVKMSPQLSSQAPEMTSMNVYNETGAPNRPACTSVRSFCAPF